MVELFARKVARLALSIMRESWANSRGFPFADPKLDVQNGMMCTNNRIL